MTTTQVVEQEQVKKKEVAVGAGALILLLLIAFAFAKKKKEDEEPLGEIVPAVTIGEIVTASPGEKGGTVRPGQTIKIAAGINNKSTKNTDYVELPVTVRYKIYEGSGIMPTPGTLLLTLNTVATLRPGITTYHNSPSYKETLRPQERRDVRVEVLYEGKVIAEKKEQDLYYVREEELKAAVEVLSIAWI